MQPSLITRRKFLVHSGLGASSLLLAHWVPGFLPRAFAQGSGNEPGEDHFFVLIRVSGGMDVTLGLDPQVLPAEADSSDLFLEYRPEDILGAEGLKFGPSAAALAPYATEIAVINGVMMRRDGGHDVLLEYISSGDGSGLSASLPVELAATTQRGPFGVVVASSSARAGMRNVILSSTSDLSQALTAEENREVLARYLALQSGTSPLLQAEEALLAAVPQSEKLAATLARFQSEGISITDSYYLAAAFLSGAAFQGVTSVFGNGSLDTHSGHEGVHLGAQKEIWSKVTEFFKFFKSIEHKGKSLFDHTTFMVVSEFSRTPALNPANGKDHNPFTNSVLLAGKNVAGGKTFGSSRLITRRVSKTGESIHTASPFDYVAGKVAESRQGASFIFPENVARTVGEIFGNPKDFGSWGKETLAIPGVAKGAR